MARNAANTRGPSSSVPVVSLPMRFMRFHVRALKEAAHRLFTTPVTSFMTMLAIAVALTLPTALDVVIRSLSPLSHVLQQNATLSIFLKSNISDDAAEKMAERLRKLPQVGQVEFISAAQALQDFKAASNLGPALDALAENPLPATLIVTPSGTTVGQHALKQLADELSVMPEAENVRVDVAWIERAQAVLRVIANAMTALSLFFVLTVVIIVANTVRLSCGLYRDDVRIAKLVGANDAYVLRPFLYMGALLGLFGAILAIGFVFLAVWGLAPEVDTLARLYNANISIKFLGWSEIATLLAAAIGLGAAGAWIAAAKHL